MPLFVESPIPPQLDLTGPPSQIFAPTTSSASSALYRSISIPSRKRCRYYESGARAWTDSSTDLISATPLSSPDGYHPSLSHLGSDDLTSEADCYRPNRYKDYPRPFDGSVESLAEVSEVRRKRSRRDPHTSPPVAPAANEKIAFAGDYGEQDDYNTGFLSQPAPVRWTRAVLGVVGKVWGFCWSGAFRGFYAGGGQGYAMTVEQGPTEKQDAMLPSAPVQSERDATPIPGEYPDDELRQNWVMVSSRDQPADYVDDAASSSRKRRAQPHRRAGSGLMRRRQSGNRTLMSAPSSSGLPTAHFSSPAKPRETPVSVETQRYMAQRRRIEREEDASLRRLNRQLQAMIKEGKQALGTRVEVDDYMED
ncbi:hypothetical protein P170DRAFT_476569 [Aspergillus steynii IBT 23096]|uniref:Uncharacterized protein n=1 Tax=Aspergillus steynii IBT 23096 TaxID=1392250 RepID=A0A2I2G4V8_9EURO|nr:uncharacterized protein P170DRAFT_476569 [Aspergillus steynii IBT 23096]PLB47916.1 hypothetical protein P170DRAFT_476569 [Aspergillus steynii IBT 23096]